MLLSARASLGRSSFQAVLGLALLSFGIVIVYRQIERRIEQIGVL